MRADNIAETKTNPRQGEIAKIFHYLVILYFITRSFFYQRKCMISIHRNKNTKLNQKYQYIKKNLNKIIIGLKLPLNERVKYKNIVY